MISRNVPDAPARAPPSPVFITPLSKYTSPKPDLVTHFMQSSQRYQQPSSAQSYSQHESGAAGQSSPYNTTSSAPWREPAPPYNLPFFTEPRPTTLEESRKQFRRSGTVDPDVIQRLSALQMPGGRFSVRDVVRKEEFKGRGSSRNTMTDADALASGARYYAAEERYYDGLPETFATTVIVHNVNAQYKQNALVHTFSQNGFEATFDFVYVPVDVDEHGRKSDVAVVNFIAPYYARKFCKYFEGFYFSGQTLHCTFSETQGFHANVRKITSLPTPPKILPALFCSGTGTELPFPKAPSAGAAAPSRPRRARTSAKYRGPFNDGQERQRSCVFDTTAQMICCPDVSGSPHKTGTAACLRSQKKVVSQSVGAAVPEVVSGVFSVIDTTTFDQPQYSTEFPPSWLRAGFPATRHSQNELDTCGLFMHSPNGGLLQQNGGDERRRISSLGDVSLFR